MGIKTISEHEVSGKKDEKGCKLLPKLKEFDASSKNSILE
jgi:hypothetical protein